MKTQFLFILFLIFVLNGYSQKSTDQKTKAPGSLNLPFRTDSGFEPAFSKTTPTGLDVKPFFNKWVFQDGTTCRQVLAPLGPIPSSPETAPGIISFTAVPANINAGQTATLTPVFENAISANILFPDYTGIGPVFTEGAYVVTPPFTTTYELVVDGPGGTRATRTVTVNVNDGLTQFLQQGAKLVATNAIGNAQQGRSVSISADGNIAIIGGDYDSNGAGAAWIWTRSGGNWTQGPKLFGSGSFPPSPYFIDQGGSVSISADGNTAIVGGRSFAWVWVQSGGVWLQQGPKLDPFIPSCSECQFIKAVSISADGNTVIIGGQYDDGNPGVVGGAWVWTRAGGVWTQQGPMLIPSDGAGDYNSITSLSLSADGNTAILGGSLDNYTNGQADGAAWIWTRSGGVWTQQGPKLIGSGAVGNGARQGSSVSLSADGNTAIVGGEGDGILPSNNTGAAWIWTRSGGTWTQQGPKLVGPGGMSASTVQGMAVALSADGNTAIVGGVAGYSQTSSALVWTRSGGVWTHQGTKLVGSEAMGIGNYQQPAVSISLSGDGNTAVVGGYGDNGGAGAAWIFTLVDPGLPTNLQLSNITIPNGTSNCYNATQTITVAGTGSAFTVQPGGSATLIAGLKIDVLPGAIVQAGGYFWGHIAPSGPFCQTPSIPAVISTKAPSEPEAPVTSSFRIYPNPTTERFILELNEETQIDKVTVDICGMWGEKIQTVVLQGERKHEFSISDKPAGLYFIRVISGNRSETTKLIKQ